MRTRCLAGNGIWIWQLTKCAGGDPARLVDECLRRGFNHVLIKGTDGPRRYATNAGTAPYIALRLREAGVCVAGWGYHYGRTPEDEARAALMVCAELGHEIYVHNAEKEFEETGGADAMRRFVGTFRSEGGENIALGLSTFALPSLHPRFPYDAALLGERGCDFVLPQAYAVDSARRPWLGDSLRYLARAREELAAHGRPIVPTLRAYTGDGRWSWRSVADDARRFMARAPGLELTGWNWWSWQSAESNLETWESIAKGVRGCVAGARVGG